MQPFNLSRGEILQIANSRPAVLVEIHLVSTHNFSKKFCTTRSEGCYDTLSYVAQTLHRSVPICCQSDIL